ncbi:MAG: hypothetical protein M3X11_08805 [Acidobacteriota bacterium]|nr:hypothetical protein [Acidobacteriota bacterium]
MEYLVKVKLPDELLSQTERAAASLGLSAEDYLRIALEEKVRRWAEDLDHQQEFDRIAKDILERRKDVFQRLAEWPE